MDVVNGKIVSARTERSRSDIWSALKPSRATVMEGSGSLQTPPAHSTWGASAPGHGSYGAAAGGGGGGQAPSSMALQPGAARWHRWPRDNILGQPHKQSLFNAAPPAALDRPVHEGFLAGWKRSSTTVTAHDHYTHHRPCECVVLFDEAMAMYESQVSRAVSSHFESASPSGGGHDLLTPCVTAASEVHPEPNAPKSQRMERTGTLTSPKRRGMELSAIDQDGVTWIAPLRSLLRKELTVSDVGELGRIILPKKDAEGQFPQIDTKGKLLEMEEYSFSKRWFFHYKWWINNKSRMYVLENTGEFIKYHGLKAHDSFVVYEDGCGNLVVRGQKKKSTPGLDNSAIDQLK